MRLHQDDVEPAVELPADLAFGPDGLEATRPVERDRRFVIADDAGDHGVEPVCGRPEDELVEERAPIPLPCRSRRT